MKILMKMFALILLLISLPANAVIIGDKDWLQITDTTGNSWVNFDAIFDTTTGECEVTACSLNGLDLTGHTWASNDEVDNLLSGLFGVAGLSSLNSDNFRLLGIGGAAPFSALFENTVVSSQVLTIGWTRNDSCCTGTGDSIAVATGTGSSGLSQDSYLLEVHRNAFGSPDFIGGWVYRSVPEPSIILLFATGLLGIGFSRRRKAKLFNLLGNQAILFEGSFFDRPFSYQPQRQVLNGKAASLT